MRGHLDRLIGVASLLPLFAGIPRAFAEPVLSVHSDSLTSYLASPTTVQKVQPLYQQRGSDLEGAARMSGAPGPVSAAFSSGYSAGMLGGIDLATLTWAQGEVDMALPTDGPSVIIGRTFNHRQGDGVKIVPSDGPQGVNWFQSAMPEIAFFGAATNDLDVIYVVLGAGRFLEYKRTALNATVFKSVNGAPGVMAYTVGAGGTPYDTYTLTDATGTVWVFWGGNTASNKADWQLWKKTDAAGRTAYAGDKTTHSTAVTNGYNADGTVAVIYQEYGTGSDLRRYSFTYGTTINSINRLTEVKAELNTGGGWSTPTEVGRVTYAYYSTSTNTTGDATDFHGKDADLKTVKVRTPLSDSGTSLGSGVYDERTKYYRYYDNRTWVVTGVTHYEYEHTLKLVLGFEGARRYDWLDTTFNDTFAGATIATSALKSYADAFLVYEDTNTDERISSAFFNGECGCGGGSGAGTYTFTPSANGSYVNNTGYDTAWCTRAVVAQPDGSYQTRYFDEVGQPLNTVVSDINPATGGALYWVAGVDRNSAGQVTTVHSPSNNTAYTHSTGAVTYSSSVGLVTFLDRYTTGEPSYDSSGELDGLVSGTGFKTGTSGTAAYTSKSVLGKRSLTVGAATVVRPLVTESRAYYAATSSYGTSNTYDATTYAYAWWNTGTNTNPLYITLKTITTTLPAVATANNGANATDDAVTYLRKDGRTAISQTTDGIYTVMKYNNLGQAVRTVRDANLHITTGTADYASDFDSGYGPTSGDFNIAGAPNAGLRYDSEATYDAVGRTVTSTARPGSAAERVAYMYYSRLSDHRLATIASPRYDSGGPTWYGPMSYGVANQGGRGEFSCTLGPSSGVSTALTSWIDETSADPIDALHSTLYGTSRAFVKNVNTTIYDTPGVKVAESRRYVVLATSSTWTGSAGTDYDRTEYAYDDMGRTIRVKDPTNTIDRTVYDAIGRRCATWTGTVDTHGWTGSAGNGSSGGNDDLVQTSGVAYDGASVASTLAVGDGYTTTSVAYVQGHITTGVGDSGTQRATTYAYDVRGNLIATLPPLAPFTVTNYDTRRRATSTAIYSNSSGLNGGSATSSTSNRIGLSETFYDERGRVYKSTRHMIYQTAGGWGSAGISGDSLDSTTWYDSAGRAIKTGGTSLTKTFYDRLGRPTNRFTLARTDDSAYANADDVSGDIVMQEDQTVYDDADKTGLVVMTATVIRNYDDTTTTGALDTNADANRYKLTMANLAGRVQISATWYDAWDRATDTVAYGTNGAADFDRYPSSVWLTVPNRGGTPLRTTTAFDAWGRVSSVEQPRVRTGTTGYSTTYQYDQASRKITEIRNDTGAGVPNTTYLRDSDLYTRYVYANGLLSKIWVDVDGDGTSITSSFHTSPDYALDDNDQVTEYVYTVDKSGHGSGSVLPPASKLVSNRLLSQTKYPKQTTSQSDTDRSEYFGYNALGQMLTKREQLGTVMDKTYDTLGRQTIDTATTVGSGLDTTVRRIETAYDSRGMVSTVTQYDATTSGTVLDQVKDTYDHWGNLATFQQDYNGTVAASSGDDLGVEYVYAKADENSPTASNYRRSGIRVTDVKLERSAGATTIQQTTNRYLSSSGEDWDDDVGRVSRITDSGWNFNYVLYTYGGVAMVVRNDLNQAEVMQEYATSGTSGYTTFLDDFGRVIKSRWRKGSNSAIWYDARPAYDDNSNINKVDNAWVLPLAAVYDSDGVNRLEKATVGKMVTGAIADADTLRTEDWTGGASVKLSQTGNWTKFFTYRGDPSSAPKEANQVRKFLGRNEPQDVADTATSAPDPKPLADLGGMITDDENGGSYGYLYTYDAWSRLVTVDDKSHNHVAQYRYNGLGHRIGWKAKFDTGLTYANNLWRYFQYNEKWQQVGMYLETSAGANTVNTYAKETYLYHTAGLDGRGGSSYIDSVVCRERDVNGGNSGDSTREEKRYYLQNWRNDVIALVDSAGAIIERYTYDAYGRPNSYTPADLTGNNNGPDGAVAAADSTQFTTAYSGGGGAVGWQTDLGSATQGNGIPDNAVTGADSSAFTAYYGAIPAYSGGLGKMSDSTVDNRKGFAGYEFDPILAGNGDPKGSAVPVYHVRHRVLNSYAGKWLQKDPLGYHDSMDLYEYCRSDAVDGSDPSGLASSDGVRIPVAFDLFLTSPRGQWIPDPGHAEVTGGTSQTEVELMTDNRGFGSYNWNLMNPNARIASQGWVDSCKIGSASLGNGASGNSSCGISKRRIRRYTLLGVGDWEEETRRAQPDNPLPTVVSMIDIPCITKMSFSVTANYPFPAMNLVTTPSIGYRVTFYFEAKMDWVCIWAEGSHTAFPYAEAYLTHSLYYSYNPIAAGNGSGPTFFNTRNTSKIRFTTPRLCFPAPTAQECFGSCGSRRGASPESEPNIAPGQSFPNGGSPWQ
jgi:RHS repeat-associated protein